MRRGHHAIADCRALLLPIMLKNLLGKVARSAVRSPELLAPAERRQAVKGSSTAELAAKLLIAPSALMQLTAEEAMVVVSFMVPRRIAAGTTFISEGDRSETGFMMLLLEGDVMVENITVSRSEPRTVTVLGPGSLIGEMSLVDGNARLASCTASGDLRCATLTRAALEKLMQDDPQTGGKLLLAISVRIAERLRETTDKLRRYAELVQVMQGEIDQLMPTPDRRKR
jgi:CRP/FNR family transcriptional regulator, cyclic AMP receptor protein